MLGGRGGIWTAGLFRACGLSPWVSAGLSISIPRDCQACLNDRLPSPPGWAPGRVGFLGSGWSPVPESCVSACVGSLTQPLMGQEGEYLGWFVMGSVAPV